VVAVYMEKRNDIDIVILDMIMPGISGGETFDRLMAINPEIRSFYPAFTASMARRSRLYRGAATDFSRSLFIWRSFPEA
jgi:two-component system cell cycle sensor histidine kinase/response regulator CckA